MPRASLRDLIVHADESRACVGAFTCYNLEQLTGVLRAAEDKQQPICLLLAEAAFRSDSGPLLARLLVSAAETATVPVAVQLDHTHDLGLMARALDVGVTAIMADGSTFSYADNAVLVENARGLADSYGASIEAELAHVPGDEDAATGTVSGTVTDPAAAVDFVERTRADVLAVAIGNVHGTYVGPPTLDLALLDRLSAVVPVPLSLHGTSGLPEHLVRDAIARGVRKVNVNTELRQAYLDTARQIHQADVDGWNLLRPAARLIEATRVVTAAHLERCQTAAGRQAQTPLPNPTR